MDQGRGGNRKTNLGGVFNTQTNIGYRGMQLQSLIDSFGLCITNALDTPWDLQWTFQSMMGIKRKIDFVFVSRSFQIISGQGSKEIDLGSDHRAVKSILHVRKRVRRCAKPKTTLKNWTPHISPSGRAEKFEAILMEKLEEENCKSTEVLENTLFEVGSGPGVQVKVSEKCKPWQSDEIKAIIQQKRVSNVPDERRRISN